MKKTISNVKIDNDKVRSRVRIEDDECLATSPLFRMGAYRLLQTIVDKPELTFCLLSPFERLSVYHNGKSWVVDAEAILEVPPGGIYAEAASDST